MIRTLAARWKGRGPRSLLVEEMGRLSSRLYDSRHTFPRALFDPGAGPLPERVYRPDAGELHRLRGVMARILTENMLPFWYPGAIDREGGGYRLNQDLEGRWMGPVNRGIVGQSRTLWFFSRLGRSVYGSSAHVDAASHGFDFLRDRMWDRRFGGFYWEVDSRGEAATLPDKHLYGQAAALYALSEYAGVSGDPSAAALCRELFELLEARAHDTQGGGYREFFARDWTAPAAGTTNYLGRGLAPHMKTVNTHLHVLESVTSYLCLTRDALARLRVEELIAALRDAVVGESIGTLLPDGSHPRGAWDYISYGHQIETVWLLLRACEAIGAPAAPLLALCRKLFANAVRYGFDRRDGGFYKAGRANAPARRRSKVWWVQAEGLMGALCMYTRTMEAPYLTCFQRTLEWIARSQVDWAHGDWFARVEHGRPSGDKADAWKDPYHHGRAMIECLHLLEAAEADRSPAPA